jgi:hypothetical protein
MSSARVIWLKISTRLPWACAKEKEEEEEEEERK